MVYHIYLVSVLLTHNITKFIPAKMVFHKCISLEKLVHNYSLLDVGRLDLSCNT